MIDRNVDILVVGAGQAGLAMGYHLKQAGYRFQLVDRNARIGDSWRSRYDSLVLFTPRAYSALPGLPVPGDADGYPSKNDVLQLTAERYKNPSQVPPGRVLVVGDGATGWQLAVELMATHEVVLATGRPRRASPECILGKSIFWWMDRLGLLGATRESRVGRYLMASDPFPGKALGLTRLRRRGILVVDRLAQVDGKRASFANGETALIDAVIWATGYRDDSTWVAIPRVADGDGRFVHQRGVSPVPGLFFVGRSWQWRRGSALLHGVGDDAAYVAGRIAEQLDARPALHSREPQHVGV
jgi:cation diffusion facilitator CzcD-associated flavoprotein CzcO